MSRTIAEAVKAGGAPLRPGVIGGDRKVLRAAINSSTFCVNWYYGGVEMGQPADVQRPRRAREARSATSLPLRMAAAAGLTLGPKTKHLNAKVTPALFAAAAKRAGSDSPAAVVEAALAALATQDDLGPWLAKNWGAFADVDPQILDELQL